MLPPPTTCPCGLATYAASLDPMSTVAAAFPTLLTMTGCDAVVPMPTLPKATLEVDVERMAPWAVMRRSTWCGVSLAAVVVMVRVSP